MRLEELFIFFLNMSITAGYVVIAVIILRLLLKKAPRWISCALWALVGLRLILPFSFESVMSIIPSSSTLTPDILYAAEPAAGSGIPSVSSAPHPVTADTLTPAAGAATPMQTVMYIAGILWVIGMLAMVLYSIVTYGRLRRKVDSAVLFRDNIYESDAVSSPFVLGIAKPRIYLPFAVSEADRSHVIAHEQAHIRRKDHWIKPFGFLLLAVYWFNPLIWGAYVLLCRDIEVACDEAVIKDMGSSERKAYSLALLDCAVSRRNIAMCPLAFGEVGIKERVQNVLNNRKPAFWVMIAAVIACIAAAICLLSNPKIAVDTSYEHPDAEQLFEHRTAYVGDNSAVANIIYLLHFPSDVAYDHIELQTASEPYGVEVYFDATPEVKASYDTSEPENIEIFRENACIMLSLIKNAGEVTFRLDDGTGDTVGWQFTREWAESIVGADLWNESSSAENLDTLITRINGHVENAYAAAPDATAAELPTGTFMPTDIVYLNGYYNVTPDGFLENHKDRIYRIESGSFCDGAEEYGVQYKIMNMEDSMYVVGDDGTSAVDISGYGKKAGWSVLNADGSDTGYRILLLDGELWIGHWRWYGSKDNAWWCDYIFRVGNTASDGGAADQGSTG